MPNIFKSFLKPAVNSYVFPDAESLQVEESPEPEGEQAEETPLQEQEPEAPHTCPVCGMPVQLDEKFCTSCGHKL